MKQVNLKFLQELSLACDCDPLEITQSEKAELLGVAQELEKQGKTIEDLAWFVKVWKLRFLENGYSEWDIELPSLEEIGNPSTWKELSDWCDHNYDRTGKLRPLSCFVD